MGALTSSMAGSDEIHCAIDCKLGEGTTGAKPLDYEAHVG